ncbi:hypothetical protein ACFL7M_11755 [Thermodesulfobacteriota bacterium]
MKRYNLQFISSMRCKLSVTFKSIRKITWIVKNLFSLVSDHDTLLKRISIWFIAGTPENYDIQLSSDLDRVPKNAVGNAVKKQAAVFETKLKQAVMAKANGPLKQAQGSLGDFNAMGINLDKRQNMGSGLLKELKLPF